MGLRSHKVMGYGLTGLSVGTDQFRTNDPRINFDSLAFSYTKERKEADTKYLDHLRGKTKNAMDDFSNTHDISLMFALRLLEQQQENSTDLNLLDNIVYDGEYGDPGTLVVIPPGMKNQWSHYDDALDNIEAALDGYTFSPKVKSIPFSPFPFEGLMDARSGEKISFELETKMGGAGFLKRALEDGKLNAEQQESVTEGLARIQQTLAELIGVENYDEFEKTIVPLVPAEVRDFAEWTGLFRDREAWKSLRPMVYTFWS